MATEKNIVQLQRWKALIQDRMNSKLKLIEWCEQNNVSRFTYYYWLKQIRKKSVTETKFKTPVISESNSFVEIQPMASSVVATAPIRARPSAIIRRDCFEIELLDDASPIFIQKLMEAVRYA
jgi:hypothetical protein